MVRVYHDDYKVTKTTRREHIMKNEYGILTKSNRALMAESRGLVTKSQAPAWLKRSIEYGKALPVEWHHTGAAANRTYYYSTEESQRLTKEEEIELKSRKAAKVVIEDANRYYGWFDEMIGGYSRGARAKWERTFFTGAVRDGKWLVLRDGQRKLANGKHVTMMVQDGRTRDYREFIREHSGTK